MMVPIALNPMSEPQQENTQEQTQSRSLDTFSDVLLALVGKVVTVANIESYEDAPVGHRLGAGFYKAEITAVKSDFLILSTHFHHSGSQADDEPVRQYVPLSRIKRVSVMKSEKILHI